MFLLTHFLIYTLYIGNYTIRDKKALCYRKKRVKNDYDWYIISKFRHTKELLFVWFVEIYNDGSKKLKGCFYFSKKRIDGYCSLKNIVALLCIDKVLYVKEMTTLT